VGILHASAPELAQEFSQEVTRQLNCAEIFALELSPVIGTHVGPATIGMAFYSEH
jgi:fatty acid-binding protein DegV